jgi:hypothetical protein
MYLESIDSERDPISVRIMLENLIVARQFNLLTDRELLFYLEQIGERFQDREALADPIDR